MTLGNTGSVDLTTLRGFTRYLTNTIDDTSKYSDAQILAVLNEEQKQVQAFLLSQLMFDWRENTLEGTGNALISLVDGTNSYNFPTDMLSIDRAEINFTGNTNEYVKAEIRKLQEMKRAVANTSNDAAIDGSKANPIIWVRNGKVYIDPIPDTNVTGGLKLHCSILVTDLSATGDSPVFAKAFHQVLCYGASMPYLLKNEEPKKATSYAQAKATMLSQMLDFYSTRDADDAVGLRPLNRSYR